MFRRSKQGSNSREHAHHHPAFSLTCIQRPPPLLHSSLRLRILWHHHRCHYTWHSHCGSAPATMSTLRTLHILSPQCSNLRVRAWTNFAIYFLKYLLPFFETDLCARVCPLVYSPPCLKSFCVILMLFALRTNRDDQVNKLHWRSYPLNALMNCNLRPLRLCAKPIFSTRQNVQYPPKFSARSTQQV